MEEYRDLAVGGGFAIGVAGVLIKFLLDRMRRLDEIVTHHLVHSTAAQDKLADSVDRLAAAVAAWHER